MSSNIFIIILKDKGVMQTSRLSLQTSNNEGFAKMSRYTSVNLWLAQTAAILNVEKCQDIHS